MPDDARVVSEAQPQIERLRRLARDAFLPEARLGDATCAQGVEIYHVGDRFSVGRAAVVAIGAFDGVHRGHKRLLELAAVDARRRGAPLLVVTFDPIPARVVGGSARASLLMETSRRLLALTTLSPDAIALYHFDQPFASLAYDEFFTERLLSLCRPLAIHVGSNFCLGKGKEGTVEILDVYLGSLGIPFLAHELLEIDGEAVSSTRIRKLVVQGRVETAAQLLGRPHVSTGVVGHGRGQGTSFGFPTANITLDEDVVFPSQGVFAGMCRQGARVWPAAINLGSPPSFSPESPKGGSAFAEASLIGFKGDLYGKTVELALVGRLRPSRRFENLQALKECVAHNLDETRLLFGESPVSFE